MQVTSAPKVCTIDTVSIIYQGRKSSKSTLLKLLAGIENPDYGNVFIHGVDLVKRRKDSQIYTGYVPHNSDLDPELSIEENIKFIGYSR